MLCNLDNHLIVIRLLSKNFPILISHIFTNQAKLEYQVILKVIWYYFIQIVSKHSRQ